MLIDAYCWISYCHQRLPIEATTIHKHSFKPPPQVEEEDCLYLVMELISRSENMGWYCMGTPMNQLVNDIEDMT